MEDLIFPYLLWSLAIAHIATSALTFNILSGSNFSPTAAFCFLMIGSFLLFWRQKAVWSVAITFFLTGGLLSIANTFAIFSGLQILAQVVVVVGLIISFSMIGFTIRYFKHPFINPRSSFLSDGRRIQFAQLIPGIMQINGSEVSIGIKDISISGALVEIQGSELKIPLTNEVVLTVLIPEIRNFKSEAMIIRTISSTSIAIQFLGRNLNSVGEHLKLFRWITFVKSDEQKPVFGNSGFSLIETMIVCAVGAVMILFTSNIFVSILSQNFAAHTKANIEDQRSEFVRTIKNPLAWQNTINAVGNSPLECVRLSGTCDFPMNDNRIDIYDAQNILVLNSRNPTAGFDNNGIPCATFDAVNGDDRCPIRYEASLQSNCVGTCRNPVLEVRIDLIHRPRSTTKLVQIRSKPLRIFKDPIVDSLIATCQSMNGSFDQQTAVCSFDVLGTGCLGGQQYLAGFNNGSPVCRNVANETLCPRGQWLNGFDVNTGEAICITL